MKITTNTVTRTTITGLENLDAVTYIMEDFGPGQGKLIVDCFGEAWSFYWGAMGDCTLSEFIASCDTDYIARKLTTSPRTVIDYEKIAKEARIDDELNDATLLFYTKELEQKYGDDWMHYLPEKPNSDYVWLCRIVDAVKKSLEANLPKAA